MGNQDLIKRKIQKTEIFGKEPQINADERRYVDRASAFIGVMPAAMQYPRIASQYVYASSRGATLVDAPSRGATRGVHLRLIELNRLFCFHYNHNLN